MTDITKNRTIMNRIPVSSSNLASVGYDEMSHILEIEFRSGGVYQYSGVPRSEYEALMSASSLGSYFAANIRNRYSYRRVR